MNISVNYARIRKEVPDHVTIVVAGKTRSKDEIEEAIDAGATDIGENYVQEAQAIYGQLGEKAKKVRWHMIGPLQKNKINKALPLFDIIQTVDSFKLAGAISKRAEKIVPVYIEVNIGGEETKRGVKPEELKKLIEDASGLNNLKIEGLMTMEPYSKKPEEARPYFQRMGKLFAEIKTANPSLKILSMGMSSSYEVAIEEGSNMVRIGRSIFGARRE
jgi:pyridoxal phosphate enzyme (YggS family)